MARNRNSSLRSNGKIGKILKELHKIEKSWR